MRLFCTVLLFFGLLANIAAQNNVPNFWMPVAPESVNLPATAQRKIQPLVSKTFQLDFDAMKSALKSAPMEFTGKEGLLLTLPQADGSMRSFKVWESPIMAPELAAKFPALSNYAGCAADGSGMIVRLGVGYSGFHAFFSDANGAIQSVRPFADGQTSYYMAYRLKDLPNDLPGGGLFCGVEDAGSTPDFAGNFAGNSVSDRGAALVSLKKYRLAIASKGEYTEFFGGTVQGALDAINVALDFISMIMERDFSVRHELIANNNLIVFLDKDTDPYTGDLASGWMAQNPGAINPIIGSTSYDQGHVFARYVTGTQVGIVSGRTCNILNKARGASSAQNPATEYFYLVAAHEMCHQLDGSHTWSNCPPNDDQLAPLAAFEPGSGTTIMSYAGSCANGNNVQSDNDPYYHLASIIEVRNFVASGEGSQCGSTVQTTNNAPDAIITTPNNLSIPVNTPFQLTGAGTDEDGDALTYCWEQFNLGPVSQLGEPIGTAPRFRSFTPTTDPRRLFPRLPIILANGNSSSEVLPDTTLSMRFRLTVRDNHPAGGGQDWAEVNLKSVYTAGPFRVTYPNSGSVTWFTGEYQTVTWDVANTDVAPVNCRAVNILLSTNGGNAFTVTLASGVPNIGRACIRVPDMVSSSVRIKIEAADNVFFDLSNANFKIQQPSTATFSACPATLKDNACIPGNYTLDIGTDGSAGFSDPITLSASGLPQGATASFSPNPVTPGATAVMTIVFPNNTPESTFDLTVDATAGSNTKSSVVTINVYQNDNSAVALETPVNGAQGVDVGPTLFWTAGLDADNYEIQVASSPSFDTGTILASSTTVTADSFKVPTLLSEGQVYYWRVRPVHNSCGAGDWTKTFVFVTRKQSCTSFVANDLPKLISSSGTPTVESKINISTAGQVGSVNVKKIQGNHQFFKDLEGHLISPSGTDVLLFKDKCGGTSGNFNIGFNDSGNNTFPCPPNNGNSYAPAQPLGAISGQPAAGDWILRIKDNVVSSGGQLTAFELELCSTVALNAPFLVNNNQLQLPAGANASISTSLLKVDDPDNTAAELTFTLVTVPKNGDLRKSGIPFTVGGQFTQAEIDNGDIRYYDYALNAGADNFDFVATDGDGGLVSGTFTIQPSTVGTKEPAGNIAFELAPNPAIESLRLFVSEALNFDSRVTLFNAAGQLLRSWTLPTGSTVLQLDVATLPVGVYAVAVENDKGRGVKKIVIQR